MPGSATALDLSYEGNPQLQDELIAFGNPDTMEFSTTDGKVSRVATTGELFRNLPPQEVAAPAEMIWIQHTARIIGGNSGGPLVVPDGRVVGINTLVHTTTQFGFASHVQYLRKMVRGARDAPKNLPRLESVLRR